jgi:DNA-binding transcriptional LysR family regulator
MELRQLRAFVAVASLRHFGHAAQSLHITQPALSQRIRSIEHEVHASLFIRTTREVQLTDAGRMLLPYAQKLIELEDRALGEMRAVTVGRTGRLRIGYYATSSPKLTTELVKQFRMQYPGVIVEPSHAHSALNLQRLRNGDIDIGVVRLPMFDLDGIDVRVIETEPYVVALPSRHHLSQEPAVNLAELKDDLWVMYPRAGNPGHFDYLVTSIERLTGSKIRVAEDEPFEEAQLASVAAGSGICLFQQSPAKRLRIEGVAFIPTVPPGIMAQLALISLPQERTTPVANFLELVSQSLDSPGPSNTGPPPLVMSAPRDVGTSRNLVAR